MNEVNEVVSRIAGRQPKASSILLGCLRYLYILGEPVNWEERVDKVDFKSPDSALLTQM